MVRVISGLYAGSDADVSAALSSGYAVLHAAKEPWHRRFVGYTGRGAPKGHPEYLWAERGDRLALNLIDADDAAWISGEAVLKGLEWLGGRLASGGTVLVHCNRGQSRSAVLCMLHLRRTGLLGMPFPQAEEAFRALYPPYMPGRGMRDFAMAHWDSLPGMG